MKTKMQLALPVVILLPLVQACGDCAGVGISHLSTGEQTIAVGESFVVGYEEGGSCHETFAPIAMTWRTVDTAVVSLDSTTGRVTGRRPGDARIAPVAAVTSGPAVVLVHVR